MNLNYDTGFSYKLIKKIEKTKEGRQGDPLYKRRNGRETRSLMSYDTYLSLFNENDLNKYTNGYVVILNPVEYFNTNIDPSIVLGQNAIVYYQVNNDDWNKHPPLPTWNQVVENTSSNGDWSGEYAVNITNANPKKLSFVTRKAQGVNAGEFAWMDPGTKNAIHRVTGNRNKTMGGKGLGNYDFDYCDKVTQNLICYQLSYLIWNNNMLEYLTKNKSLLIKNDLHNAPKKGNYKTLFRENLKALRDSNLSLNDCKEHVTSYCKENGLIDFDKLIAIGALNKEKKTVCPLCQKEIMPEDFFKKVEQDQGRESVGNTITEIVLMHIEPLLPGKLNNNIYNLGWGHHFCNTVQGNYSIINTVDRIANILKSRLSFYQKIKIMINVLK
jgi:hypothetical protein